MCRLRFSGPFILTALLTATLSPQSHAQSFLSRSSTPTPAAIRTSTDPSNHSANTIPTPLPDAPLPPAPVARPADAPFAGSILGTVLDAEGAEIPNAVVTLENTASKAERTLTTGETGFFKFDSVEPGRFNLTVTSAGFTPWATGVALHTGESYDVPSVALEVASALTSVVVTATSHDIAEDQMHFEEKQRVLGVFPNFYASYVWNAAPLSAGQKFRLALSVMLP